jgi:isopentenyl-diphosphate delta-isomerase
MTIHIPAWIDGELTPVEKLEVHRRGLRHKAVSVFLLAGDEVLLQRRAAGKYHTPGLWANACCTHPGWSESAVDCAARRLDEELGVGRVDLAFRGTVEYRADVGDDLVEHEVVDLFVAEVPRDLPVRPDPAEVEATRWMPLAELKKGIADRPQDFTPWLRIYLDRHAAAIFGAPSTT